MGDDHAADVLRQMTREADELARQRNELLTQTRVGIEPAVGRAFAPFGFRVAMMIDHGRVKSDRHGFTLHVCQLRPASKGHIGLKSTDPFSPPLIQPNYLAVESDRAALREGVRIARRIFAQPAFDTCRGPEMAPGAHVQSDSEIDAWIARTAETIYHPVGTAKMGTDEMAVVDAQLRVRGIEGLRVVDASVMPTLVGGNTNAPTIMVAEKASDMILGKSAPPAEDVRVAEDVAATRAA